MYGVNPSIAVCLEHCIPKGPMACICFMLVCLVVRQHTLLSSALSYDAAYLLVKKINFRLSCRTAQYHESKNDMRRAAFVSTDMTCSRHVIPGFLGAGWNVTLSRHDSHAHCAQRRDINQK